MKTDNVRIVLQWVCLCWLLAGYCCTGAVQEGDVEKPDDGREAVIFIYHRFGDARYPGTSVQLEDFAQHLAYLQENGFTVMTMGEAISYIDDPSVPAVDRVAVLTVDDGFASFYTNAMPILRKYGFAATLFINPGSIGGSDYMTWQQLAEVQQQGIEIGNHSFSHAHFVDIPANERRAAFERDLTDAQVAIHEHLGIRPDIYAYPYGEFDEQMQQVLRGLGFRAAVAQYSGVLYAGTDWYAIPRFSMVGSLAAIDGFREKAHMRALRVDVEKPAARIMNENKLPTLTLRVASANSVLREAQAQCFIQGGQCALGIDRRDSTLIFTVQASGKASQRRHIYTITVPDTAGLWHWYSKQWIFPSFRE
jgi:peptidoglycan/xylan/chitin deacetylase (PgdA/CDA1 family)